MTLIPIGCYSVHTTNQSKSIIEEEEVNMETLAILGDFLSGVGIVLLGVAAIYYVMISKKA
jgi:hypothetical protein